MTESTSFAAADPGWMFLAGVLAAVSFALGWAAGRAGSPGKP